MNCTWTSASIPLQYNTCATVGLTFEPHTLAVLTEKTNSIQVYLNNYRTDKDPLWQQNPGGMSYSQVQSYIDSTFIPSPPDHTAPAFHCNS